MQYLDKRARQGEGRGFTLCSRWFLALSIVFVLDFIGNLIYNVPFPSKFLLQAYGFFIGITILEFVLSSIAIWQYYRAVNFGRALWIITNLAITIAAVIIFIQSFGGNYLTDFWIKVAIWGFVFREVLVLWNAIVESR